MVGTPNTLDGFMILSTGGTFNKYYDPREGSLRVDHTGRAVKELCRRFGIDVPIDCIIGKDSLDMDDRDRGEILQAVRNSAAKRVLIVHGTDTMDRSADFLAGASCRKRVVFCGSMIPYSIDATEAAANFAFALGFLGSSGLPGIYIAMHGIAADYRDVFKDREAGLFRLSCRSRG